MSFFYKPGQRLFMTGLLAVLALLSMDSFGNPSDIDTRFGKNGLLQAPWQAGHAQTWAFDVLQLADGHYLAIDARKNGQFYQLELQRFAADGSWDSRYINRLPMSLGNIYGYSGAKFLSNGKIMVIVNAAQGIELIRLNSDGSRDESFGYSGLKQVQLGESGYWFVSASDFALLPDDRMAIAVIVNGVNFGPGIMMVDAKGDIDSNFGNQGVYVYSDDNSNGPPAVVVDSHLRILMSFTALFGGDTKVLKLLGNGKGLDPDFGSNGIGQFGLNSGFNYTPINIIIQPDDKPVVSIPVYDNITGETDAYIGRLNADGSKDTGLNGSGNVKIQLPQDAYQTNITSIALHNGKLIVAGYSSTLFNGEWQFIEQLNSDGSPDVSFAKDGRLVKPQRKRATYINRIRVLQNGGIMVAAQSNSANSDVYAPADMTIFRFNDNGQLDNHFGNNGQRIIRANGLQVKSWNAMARQSDDRFVVAGEIDDANSSFDNNTILARYHSDGSPDTSFGGNASGIARFGIKGFSIATRAMLIQVDNKILTCGTLEGVINGHYGSEILVLRYNADGSLDTSFFDHGMAKIDFTPLHPKQTDLWFNQQCTALRDLGQGRIGFVGNTIEHWHSDDTPGHRETLLGILNANNTLKNTLVFGKDLGNAFADLAGQDMILSDDAHIVVSALGVHGDSIPKDLVTAKFDTNNLSLDSSYGSGGFTTSVIGDTYGVGAGQLLKQSDGKLIAIATSDFLPATYQSKASAIRYNIDGSIDTSFASGGEFSATYLPNSRIYNSYSGGFTNSGNIMLLSSVYYKRKDRFGLMRLNMDGSLDTRFSYSGKRISNTEGHRDIPMAFLQMPDGTFLVAGNCDGIACIARYLGDSINKQPPMKTLSMLNNHGQLNNETEVDDVTPEKRKMALCIQEQYRTNLNSLSQFGGRISLKAIVFNSAEMSKVCLGRK